MFMTLNISDEEYIELIESNIKFAIFTSKYIFYKPDILSKALEYSEFVDHVKKIRRENLQDIYLAGVFEKGHYGDGDGSINHEKFEILMESLGVYENITIRSEFLRLISFRSYPRNFEQIFIKLLELGIDPNHKKEQTNSLLFEIINCQSVEYVKKFVEFYPNVVDKNHEQIWNTTCVDTIDFFLEMKFPLPNNMSNLLYTTLHNEKTFIALCDREDFKIDNKTEITFIKLLLNFENLTEEKFDRYIAKVGIDLRDFSENLSFLVMMLNASHDKMSECIIKKNIFNLNYVDKFNNCCVIQHINNIVNETTKSYENLLKLIFEDNSFVLAKHNIDAIKYVNCEIEEMLLRKVDSELSKYMKKHIDKLKKQLFFPHN